MSRRLMSQRKFHLVVDIKHIPSTIPAIGRKGGQENSDHDYSLGLPGEHGDLKHIPSTIQTTGGKGGQESLDHDQS